MNRRVPGDAGSNSGVLEERSRVITQIRIFDDGVWKGREQSPIEVRVARRFDGRPLVLALEVQNLHSLRRRDRVDQVVVPLGRRVEFHRHVGNSRR